MVLYGAGVEWCLMGVDWGRGEIIMGGKRKDGVGGKDMGITDFKEKASSWGCVDADSAVSVFCAVLLSGFVPCIGMMRRRWRGSRTGRLIMI